MNYYYIQCTSKTGKRGTFVKNKKGEEITPVFKDIVECINYCHKNNIKVETSLPPYTVQYILR